MVAEQVTIVLGEDDEGHASLIRRNLERAGILNEVVHLSDGQAVLDYLRSEGTYAGCAPPRALVILLDIKMPRLDGVETLRQLKGDERTKHIPVLMLTTTDDPREIEQCYHLGCSLYITKPVEYDNFTEAVRRLGLFLQVVKLPERRAA